MGIHDPAPVILEEGVEVAFRRKINFIGASITAEDDDTNGRVNVTVTGGGGAHALGGASHTADTLANLNGKISDATLLEVDDATSDPLIDGDAAADGTEASVARKDHVHPKHHAKYTDANAISAIEGEATLDLAGDVTIGDTKSLSVDVINEKDADGGVTIDSVVLKDGLVDGVDVAARDHAVYTDGEALAAGQDDATSDPLIDGDAAADGTEESFARKDHVHPKHHAAYNDSKSLISAFPVTAGKVFPNFHIGASNGRAIEGLGVMASLDGDATWEVWFPLPTVAPTGTMKLLLASFADVAATQSIYLRILWAGLAPGENFDTIALNDEHSAGTLEIEHTTADDDELVETLVTLDADTITYGTDRFIIMHIDLKTASWDMAVVPTLLPLLVWE